MTTILSWLALLGQIGGVLFLVAIAFVIFICLKIIKEREPKP